MGGMRDEDEDRNKYGDGDGDRNPILFLTPETRRNPVTARPQGPSGGTDAAE